MIHRHTPLRVDKETGERMSEMVSVYGPNKVPLEDLLYALQEAGVEEWEYGQVMVHSATLRWERPATEAEKQEWERKGMEQKARLEKWEREQYERLKEKYG